MSKYERRMAYLVTAVLLALVTSTSTLNISSGYEPYLRPNSGAVADIVKVSIELISIRQIHENDMEFTVDFFLRKYWTDPRLIGAVRKDTLFTSHVPQIWAPDLYIANSVNSKHPDDYSRAFQLTSDGQVMLRDRMVSQISCSMGFAKFPFDSQVCEMNFKSYGHSTIHLNLIWHGIVLQNVPVFHNEYSFRSAEQTTRTEKTSSGEFRNLILTITFARSGVRYLRRAIIPSAILVFICYFTMYFTRRKNEDKRHSTAESEQETADKTVGPELELSAFQMGLIRFFVNSLMLFNLIFIGQINLLTSPSTATITGLDVWLGVMGLIVFILFIQSLVHLLKPKKNLQKIDKGLRLGIPLFFLLFLVIYFAIYLT